MLVKKEDRIEVWSDERTFGIKRELGKSFVVLFIMSCIILIISILGGQFYLTNITDLIKIIFIISWPGILGIFLLKRREKNKRHFVTINSDYIEMHKGSQSKIIHLGEIDTMNLGLYRGLASIAIRYKENSRNKVYIFYFPRYCIDDMKIAIKEYKTENIKIKI